MGNQAFQPRRHARLKTAPNRRQQTDALPEEVVQAIGTIDDELDGPENGEDEDSDPVEPSLATPGRRDLNCSRPAGHSPFFNQCVCNLLANRGTPPKRARINAQGTRRTNPAGFSCGALQQGRSDLRNFVTGIFASLTSWGHGIYTAMRWAFRHAPARLD